MSLPEAVAKYAVAVNWKMPSDEEFQADNSWKEASQEAKNLGISRYRLYRNVDDTKWYQWVLQFTNTTGWEWRFLDEAGDHYDCSTVINGNHDVQYNSKKPNIVAIINQPS